MLFLSKKTSRLKRKTKAYLEIKQEVHVFCFSKFEIRYYNEHVYRVYEQVVIKVKWNMIY